jgi:competence protein ComEA
MKTLKHTLLLLACAVACPLLAFAGPVDINSADAETISTELQGIGMSKAEAIVEYRKVHGPFRSVDDLALVKGIGPRTIEINRSNILLQPAPKKPGK